MRSMKRSSKPRSKRTAAMKRSVKVLMACESRLTTQAQRPGPRDATIATGMRWPGSLQRMVRPRCRHALNETLLQTQEQEDRCDEKKCKSSHGVRKWPNDPSSATRPAGRHDCNSDAMAGFAAAHG